MLCFPQGGTYCLPRIPVLPPTSTCYRTGLLDFPRSPFSGFLSYEFLPPKSSLREAPHPPPPHLPPTNPQLFIPTSIYGQPVRSRLEWYTQLDEQFPSPPPPLPPTHNRKTTRLNSNQ